MLKEIIRNLNRPLDDVKAAEIILSPCRDLVVGIYFRYIGRKKIMGDSYWGGAMTVSIVTEIRQKYNFPITVKVLGEDTL